MNVLAANQIAPILLTDVLAISFPAAPWIVMWSIALALFFSAKLLTIFSTPSLLQRKASCFSYLSLWVGMDPRPFVVAKAGNNWSFAMAFGAVLRILAGMILLWVVAPALWDNQLTAGWIGLIGLVLLLHFGLFDLLAAAWQNRGIAVEPIMRQPLRSRTLAEFWGERWNRAFNSLMVRFVFRPTVKTFRPTGAAFVVFLVSGLIHDLVISVPARGGYGLPSLYFVVEFVGMTLQKSRFARVHRFQKGWKGWLFTMSFAAIPLPLLFHSPFILRVIIPFLEVIGASGGSL